jgi:hypothetical protein
MGKKKAKPRRPPVATTPPQWLYVPDEDPKRKHHWDHPYAGFVEVAGVSVAKCPNNIGTAEAQRLLNNGLSWYPRGWRKLYPKRIYNILDKIVYRATPTNPGQSYHAFPEHAKSLPPEMKPRLRALAEQLDCLEEVEQWFKG